MKKLAMVAGVSALAAVLVMAGCGGKDAKDKPAPSVAANDNTATAVTDTTAATATDTVTFPQIISDDGFEMVFVEGGTFKMGCAEEQDCDDGDKPAHSVTLNSFYIAKYETTFALWKSVMGNDPGEFCKYDGRGDCSAGRYDEDDNFPVILVSWLNVQGFIRKLNAKTGKEYRLPTEAEWEYAARGGNKSKGYRYSGNDTVGNVAWYWKNTYGNIRLVGTKAPNELGLYDMSGNVKEYVNDRYGDYSSDAQTNPTGPSSGVSRVCRGGGCGTYHALECRVSYRASIPIGQAFQDIGFRLAHNTNTGGQK